MNDNILMDSIKGTAEVYLGGSLFDTHNPWLWFAVIELIIIIFLLLLKKRTDGRCSTQRQIKEEILSEKVDFGNIINSSFNAQALYDSLKVRCHPDKFATNPAKYRAATRIFQEITKNKRNYRRLTELREEIERELETTPND
jgi:hypothetical protein